jgi:hypothetical protein
MCSISGEFIVNEPLKYFTVGNKKNENLPDDRLLLASDESHMSVFFQRPLFYCKNVNYSILPT